MLSERMINKKIRIEKKAIPSADRTQIMTSSRIHSTKLTRLTRSVNDENQK